MYPYGHPLHWKVLRHFIYICYKPSAHKIFLRNVIPIWAFLYCPQMHNLPKWPIMVVLVPVRALLGTHFLVWVLMRALLGTHFLSVRGLVGILYLILKTVISVCAQFSWKYCLARSVPRKGWQGDNDRTKLVFTNFGIPVCKQSLTMRAMRLAICAQGFTMRALFYIVKNVHMVSHNVKTNLVRIWSITYTNRRHR